MSKLPAGINQKNDKRDAPDANLVMDSLPFPLIVVNSDNRICSSNAAAEDFFQAGVTVLLRSGLEDFIPADSPFVELVNRARDKNISVNEYALNLDMLHSRTGSLVDIHVTPIGRNSGLLLILIMHRHMADTIERQLTHRHAARSMSGMASILAHEIKNPLSGIRGAAQLLEMGLSEEDRSLTQLIRDEADRIVRLIDRMDALADTSSIERLPINIHQVLHHVSKLANNGIAANVPITERYDPSLPPVAGNRDQLIQVFFNLVKNAAESIGQSGEPGEIIITSAFRPGMRLSVSGAREQINLPLEFCVTDTGPGVAPDLMSNLFDPFVTTKPSGTGLGLALVARIIDLHGGVIECKSKPGKTVFRVLLPIYDEQEK